MANERKNKLRESSAEEGQPARQVKSKRSKSASASSQGRFARFLLFLRDERVHKVTGLFLVLASFYLLVAFTSYLFTWQTDQSQVGRTWSDLFQPDVRVENWLGKIGALLSHRFIFVWFGIAAFIFVLWTFLTGVRISLRTWLLPFGKTLRWSVMGLFWLPTLLGFFFPKEDWQVLGGGIGYAINNHLAGWLGSFGAGALILFSAIAFLVYTFNPSLHGLAALFERKPTVEAEAEAEADDLTEVRGNRIKEQVPEPVTEEVEADDEEVQAEPSEPELETEAPWENAPEPVIAEVPAPLAATVDLSGITEEANGFSVEATVQEEALTEAEIETKLKELGEYDPTLDLSSYIPLPWTCWRSTAPVSSP